MRIVVFFDLPTQTLDNKREYRKFRKFLIKKGFIMMQESVYCKLALNSTIANLITADVKKNKPSEGLVQMMVITEKQYNKIECIVGESKSSVIDSDERIVII